MFDSFSPIDKLDKKIIKENFLLSSLGFFEIGGIIRK